MATARVEETTNTVNNTAATAQMGTAITTRATATRQIRPLHLSTVLRVLLSCNQETGRHNNYDREDVATAQTGMANTSRATVTFHICCVSHQLIRQSSAVVTGRNTIPNQNSMRKGGHTEVCGVCWTKRGELLLTGFDDE